MLIELKKIEKMWADNISRKEGRRIDGKSAVERECRGLVTIIGLALIYFSGSTERRSRSGSTRNKFQFK